MRRNGQEEGVRKHEADRLQLEFLRRPPLRDEAGELFFGGVLLFAQEKSSAERGKGCTRRRRVCDYGRCGAPPGVSGKGHE